MRAVDSVDGVGGDEGVDGVEAGDAVDGVGAGGAVDGVWDVGADGVGACDCDCDFTCAASVRAGPCCRGDTVVADPEEAGFTGGVPVGVCEEPDPGARWADGVCELGGTCSARDPGVRGAWGAAGLVVVVDPAVSPVAPDGSPARGASVASASPPESAACGAPAAAAGP